MASKPEFVQHVCDLLESAGMITNRKMFGEYGIYCDGKLFALICDNQLFIKITEAGKAMMGPNRIFCLNKLMTALFLQTL